MVSLLGVGLICSSNARSAQESGQCVVPLKLVNIRSSGSSKGPEYKLGIYVGLGGGAPQLYELDTGGPGFWAAYTSTPNQKKGQWWGNYELVQGESNALTAVYSSGNTYLASLVNTQVALYGMGKSGLAERCKTAVPVGVAQINRFSNNKDPSAGPAWTKALADGAPPLFNTFYGDFGAALFPIMTADNSAGVYSILPQLPQDNLINGFIVHVGPLRNSKPTLTIGITEEQKAQFTTQLPMNQTCQSAKGAPSIPSPDCPAYPSFPVSDMATWSEQVTNANLFWSYGKSGNRIQQCFSDIGLTIDTGAPPTTLWVNDALYVDPYFLSKPSGTTIPVTGTFNNGVNLAITAPTQVPGGQDLDLNLMTGTVSSVNKVTASSRSSSEPGPAWSGYMNTGLMLFTQYDIMFDLENGVVGLRPVKK